MFRRFLRAGLVVGLFIVGMPTVAYAQYTSPHYQVDEIFIGGGSVQNSCSGNQYCSNQTAGGTAVGDSKSDNFGAQAGGGDASDASIEVSLSNTNVDLGVLNSSSTSAASVNFSVKNYLSDGYIVKIYGSTPRNTTGPGTHTLTNLNSPSASQPGTEQFGINLVANTTPGIGASPSQAPDNTFSFGEAEAGYDTPDYFKYVSGDTIARSNRASGETNYTISIIANIASTTPGGQYKTSLVVQVIASF